jgi:hypothetical protein
MDVPMEDDDHRAPSMRIERPGSASVHEEFDRRRWFPDRRPLHLADRTARSPRCHDE